MDKNNAKLFYYVAMFKSYSIASERLLIAQSSISRRVKSLERELGVQLILRNSKQFELTKYGVELYEIMQGIVFETNNFEREGSSGESLKIGVVGIMYTWAQRVAMRVFSEEYWNIQFFYESWEYCLKAMQSGEIDGVISGNSLLKEACEFCEIQRQKIVIVADKNFDKSRPYTLYYAPYTMLNDGDILKAENRLELYPCDRILLTLESMRYRKSIENTNNLLVVLEDLVKRDIESEKLSVVGEVFEFDVNYYYLIQNREILETIEKYRLLKRSI